MMKKISRILMAGILAAVAVSCGEAIELPQGVTPSKPDDPHQDEKGYDGDITLTATISYVEGASLQWTEGAPALICDGTSVHKVVNRSSDVTTGSFDINVPKGTSAFSALYPAMEGAKVGLDKISFVLGDSDATTQAAECVMVAAGTTPLLYFTPLTTTISFNVGTPGITEVIFESLGREIFGEIDVTFIDGAPQPQASSRAVSIRGDFQPETVYSFQALAAELHEGYKVTVKSGNEELSSISIREPIELPAGHVIDLGNIREDTKVYRIKHLWLWGGTGPEYSCTKVYDLLTKDTWFDSEDGRGITAMLDDYLEFAPGGVFNNWAGEDERHWWMALDKEQTPDKSKSLDIAPAFKVFPKNKGAWSLNGESLYTFMNEEGNTTSAEMVPAGTYIMPKTSPELSITIETQALMFTLSGTDYWDNPASNYDVVYKHPRVLYAELEEMPQGFSVPDASRTTDIVEFKEKEPDPGPDPTEFDVTTLPGTYRMWGDNKNTYGMQVLGGSGNDPAFVKPVDKSWCWSSTVKNETDNKLIIGYTTTLGALYRGTFNYTAGNDGIYWDYIWHPGKDDEKDMSSVYGRLAHGESEFTLISTTMTFALDNGYSATLLPPGTHTFAETGIVAKTLEVPQGCIALDFRIMDPIGATAQRWTDIDRFVTAPLHYVIIFEKEN